MRNANRSNPCGVAWAQTGRQPFSSSASPAPGLPTESPRALPAPSPVLSRPLASQHPGADHPQHTAPWDVAPSPRQAGPPQDPCSSNPTASPWPVVPQSPQSPATSLLLPSHPICQEGSPLPCQVQSHGISFTTMWRIVFKIIRAGEIRMQGTRNAKRDGHRCWVWVPAGPQGYFFYFGTHLKSFTISCAYHLPRSHPTDSN